MRNGRGGSRGSRIPGFKNDIAQRGATDEGLPEESTKIDSEIDSDSAKPSETSGKANFKAGNKSAVKDTSQIEYLIHQSSLGVHFLFDKKDIARVMMVPTDEKDFFTLRNMERVQSLLSRFLEKPTLQDKERFLKSLKASERDLMIRAYFHLVENAIQSNFQLKH